MDADGGDHGVLAGDGDAGDDNACEHCDGEHAGNDNIRDDNDYAGDGAEMADDVSLDAEVPADAVDYMRGRNKSTVRLK